MRWILALRKLWSAWCGACIRSSVHPTQYQLHCIAIENPRKTAQHNDVGLSMKSLLLASCKTILLPYAIQLGNHKMWIVSFGQNVWIWIGCAHLCGHNRAFIDKSYTNCKCGYKILSWKRKISENNEIPKLVQKNNYNSLKFYLLWN